MLDDFKKWKEEKKRKRKEKIKKENKGARTNARFMFQDPTQAALPTRNRLRRPGRRSPIQCPSHHRSVAVSALVFKMDVVFLSPAFSAKTKATFGHLQLWAA